MAPACEMARLNPSPSGRFCREAPRGRAAPPLSTAFGLLLARGLYQILTGASSFTQTSGTRERSSATHDMSETVMNTTISTAMPNT